MAEFFPSADAIRAGADAARSREEELRRRTEDEAAHRATWRGTNLAILGEFLRKTGAAGIVRQWSIPAHDGATGYTRAANLVPGNPPHWVEYDHVMIDDYSKEWGERERVIEFLELPQLTEWDPEWLREALVAQLPR